MNLDYRLGPDLTELSPDEGSQLGMLVEHPAWPLFLKYLHTERWATINNGFIKAKDSVEFGYCQGDVGRINKIEADMSAYHAQSKSKSQVDTMIKEDHNVTNSMLASYTDDVDLPLAP